MQISVKKCTIDLKQNILYSYISYVYEQSCFQTPEISELLSLMSVLSLSSYLQFLYEEI